MSSSSNAQLLQEPVDCSDDDSARTRARVLAGIAWECATLANQIADLGATLSTQPTLPEEPVHMIQLQAFDRLTQCAHAQAQIIAHVAREIMISRPSDAGQMLELIDAIPLHDVRMRLREALGAVPSHAHTESGTADLWD